MKILEFTTAAKAATNGMNDEVVFNTLLSLERKRSERTGVAFLFVVIKLDRIARLQMNGSSEQIRKALAGTTRETDVTGWHRYLAEIGVIFTALNGTSRAVTQAAISSKIRKLLSQYLNPAEIQEAEVKFHFFPENNSSGEDIGTSGNKPYADRRNNPNSRKTLTVLKRTTTLCSAWRHYSYDRP
jgi:hypothetical protein